MILGYSSLYPPDEVERVLPDAAAARSLVAAHRPDIPGRIDAMVMRVTGGEGSPRHADAALLGLARLGLRHGGFGDDFHPYHNEDHVLELAERRLSRVLDSADATGVPREDGLALILFAACHDLRQRETVDVPGPIGGNEAASIAECFRILAACGFARDADRSLFIALELMIAGSTFDPRPLPHSHSEAEDLASVAGGSLARSLGLWLDGEHPEWNAEADVHRGERLGRLAADLDTANVAEAFPLLADSALRLCRERESLAGRALDSPASAAPCLGFLSRGQLMYFFHLHRFCSREGERTFGPQKVANGPCVRRVTGKLLERFEAAPPANGQAVLDAFTQLAAAEAG